LETTTTNEDNDTVPCFDISFQKVQRWCRWIKKSYKMVWWKSI